MKVDTPRISRYLNRAAAFGDRRLRPMKQTCKICPAACPCLSSRESYAWRGVQKTMVKLNENQVLEIYSRAANGEKHAVIAEVFGVTYKNVNEITRGKTWRHLNLKPLTRNPLVKENRGKSLTERLLSGVRVNPVTGCHEWTHRLSKSGYGNLGINGRPVRAHRVAYEVFKGPIPEGMMVLHSCDNPCCINPSHLRVGSAQDNMDDKKSRGRSRYLRGSEVHQTKLTEKEVLWVLQANKNKVRSDHIANQLGVTKQVVSGILRGRTWRWLTGLRPPEKLNKLKD